MYFRATHGLGGVPIHPFRKSLDNLVSGFKERVFFIDAEGTKKPVCKRPASDLDGLVNELSRRVGVLDRATGGEFLATRTGPKRALYERAVADLKLVKPTLGRLAELSFFTKFESTTWVKPQVPRIISPRAPGFNYLLGRYTMVAEHYIYDTLQTMVGSNSPVVAKGLTMQAKAQAIVDKMKPGWCCTGLDASRFDQCIQEELLTAEHKVYTNCFPGDRLLAALLKHQLKNRGVGRVPDGVVKAVIGAMRCSGDQNTSLGISSSCASWRYCLLQRKVS